MHQEFKKYEQAIEHLFAYLHNNVGMTRDQLYRLAQYFIIRNFDKKAMVVIPGEIDHYFNFIAKGALRKYVISGKNEYTLQLSTEGHFIHAELSFFTQTPSDCFIEAIEPAVLFSIRFEDLEKLYDEMPGLDRMARLMIGEMYLKKEIRDMSYIRQSPRDRFLHYVERHPDMLQRVSQKYIASYLQIKPETFSRLKHLLMNRPPA